MNWLSNFCSGMKNIFLLREKNSAFQTHRRLTASCLDVAEILFGSLVLYISLYIYGPFSEKGKEDYAFQTLYNSMALNISMGIHLVSALISLAFLKFDLTSILYNFFRRASKYFLFASLTIGIIYYINMFVHSKTHPIKWYETLIFIFFLFSSIVWSSFSLCENKKEYKENIKQLAVSLPVALIYMLIPLCFLVEFLIYFGDFKKL